MRVAAMQEPFRDYAKRMVANAQTLAGALTERGFRLVSGGTDNHLLLVNVTNKGLTGKEMEELLEHVGITANKNTVPFDQQSPFVTSGVRLGTPALTTRGMGPEQMREIASIMDAAVAARGADPTRDAAGAGVDLVPEQRRVDAAVCRVELSA